MKNNLTLTPGVVISVCLGLTAVTLAACESSPKLISWQEEVKLSSGEILVVTRTAKVKPFGEIGGPGGWENKGMTFVIASRKRADDPPVWDFPFVPVVFDRDTQTAEWFVVATFYSCQSWNDLGRPKLPYAEYRLKNGQWVQGQLSPSAIGLKANMETGVKSNGEPPMLTVTQKELRMTEPKIAKEYTQVVATWSTSC